jgi:hypothetical protein
MRTPVFCFLLVACAGSSEGNPNRPHDADSDGITDDLDCDPNDPLAADLEEICDGIDNNCNNQVDEGLMQTWYSDYDGDGYGDPSTSFARCMAQKGFVLNNDDCDDRDEDVGPCKD